MALKTILFVSGVVSSHASSDASAVNSNPIRKVVTMLQAMEKKVEAEGERDKELFDKFMCYCKTGVGSLQKGISDANTKMPQLGSDIEAGIGALAQLKSDVKTAQSDRAEAKAAMEAATSLRQKEAATYDKESNELKTNLAAISKAVKAISGGAGSAFLQTASAEVLKIIAEKADMQDGDRQDLLAFLSSSSDVQSQGSGEIIGILKTMSDEMSADLKSSTADEEAAVKSFDELIAAKTKEVDALNKAIETKLSRIGELGVEIQQMKNDLSDTEETLMENQKFLADLEKDCSSKAGEYQEIVKTRQEELLALADTIKLLNDDDALELFKKTLPGASALLQVDVDSVRARQSALLHILRARDASMTRQPQLDFIALAIKGKKIGLEKVIKMIDDMVAILKQDQLDDDGKKEYCTVQLDLSDDKKKGLEKKIGDLETSITGAQDGIVKLSEELAALADTIKATDKAVAEMTEQRQDESKEYLELMSSNGAAKEILAFAKNRLNKFYNPKLYKPPSFIQISIHKQDPGPAPEAPGAHKKQESGGVIAMIDALVQDLEKEITEGEANEKNAQKDYEEFMADAAASRSDASKSLTDKTAAKADLEASLEVSSADKASSEKELMATVSYIDSLHLECDFLLKYFDMRKESRAGEIDAMGNAKAVLNGAVM